MNLHALGWLSPARRSWPLVGLALTLAACTSVEPQPGPEGPQGPQGDPGVQGQPGPTGSEGFATLIDAVDLDRGSDCPYGGTRYDMGLDNGDGGGVSRDGLLQQGEIDDSSTVCNASGTVSAWDIPTGPAGTATIVARGGTGSLEGGDGGTVGAVLVATGGNVQATSTGILDTSFSLVAATPYYGPEKLTVSNGASLTPSIFANGGDTAVADNVYYTFTNTPGQFHDDRLYVKHGGIRFEVTGVEIQAGGTFTVPIDTGNNVSILTFDRDIRNGGTITTPLTTRDRKALILSAHHFFGDAGSTIDLTGGNGGGSTTSGQGGNLLLALTSDPDSISTNAFQGTYNSDSSCPIGIGDGTGGFYNAGTIDITPGTTATAESGRPGRYINICASDEVQNTGNLTALGRGSGQGGTIQLYGGEGGVWNSATLDVRGTSGFGLAGANGGGVRIQGAFVSTNGHILGGGGDVPTSTNCDTSTCVGGRGGSYQVMSLGGPAAVTGQVDLPGGNAMGSGAGTLAHGGVGGSLFVQAVDGYDARLDTSMPAGDIHAAPNVDARGGNGGAYGGEGGQAVFAVTGGEGSNAEGQSVSLMGYASVDLSGGDSATTGGYGGEYLLLNGDGFWTFFAKGGPVPPGASSGSAVNTVPVDLSGGTGGTGAGGYGGEFTVWARWPLPMLSAQAVNRGAVDLRGGAGFSGGFGGGAQLFASGLVESTGALDLSGANGNLSTGGGGYGGSANLMSQQDNVGLHGVITSDGGDGISGGAGGFTWVEGSDVDVTGSVLSAGGDGGAASGTGGEGGHIEVWSSDTFSVVTGTLSSTGGAGLTSLGGGFILVDGFVEQALGETP